MNTFFSMKKGKVKVKQNVFIHYDLYLLFIHHIHVHRDMCTNGIDYDEMYI
jgi:hypothetical protein